jgi:hypothetical protein
MSLRQQVLADLFDRFGFLRREWGQSIRINMLGGPGNRALAEEKLVVARAAV